MKAFLKSAANTVALLFVWPAFLTYKLAVWTLGSEMAFSGWSQAFALVPGLIGIYLRRAFYRLTLPRCETDSCLCFGTVFCPSPPRKSDGMSTWASIVAWAQLRLRMMYLISSHVSIPSGGKQHGIDRLDIPIREQPGTWSRVTIGRDSFDRRVRGRCPCRCGTSLCGGAGSVVTEPIPDYAIAVGVPAKVVRYRNQHPSLDQFLDPPSSVDLVLPVGVNQ